jgi:hypothetical protein
MRYTSKRRMAHIQTALGKLTGRNMRAANLEIDHGKDSKEQGLQHGAKIVMRSYTLLYNRLPILGPTLIRPVGTNTIPSTVRVWKS